MTESIAINKKPFRADGVEDGNHHSKVSSSCEIFLKLKPKCRYSRRVLSGAGTEGRRKPESETSESVSLCAAGRHPDHGRRGRAEGVSGAPCRCQNFTTSKRPGKLKNWKSEKLTSGPPTRTACIDFQNFRISDFHPSTCRPKIWLGESGAEWGRGR
jgi:hypothetical protein